jgi:hypothetical protein
MRRSIRFGRARILAVPLLTLLAVSCGGSENRVSESGATLEGTVKYDGEPLRFAMIMVRTDTATASGRIGEDGRYKIENVPLGEVSVGVNTAAAQGEANAAAMAGGAYKGPGATGKGKAVGVKFIPIPAKYHDPTTSGLKTTVNKGANTYNIEVPK